MMYSKLLLLSLDNDEYLNGAKACMLNDAALLTVKVAGAKAGEFRLLFIVRWQDFIWPSMKPGHA